MNTKMDVDVYARNAANLLQNGKSMLQIGFELIDPITNRQLTSAIVGNVTLSGGTQITASLLLPLTTIYGRAVRLRPFLYNLDISKVHGALVHEFGAYPAVSQQEKPSIAEMTISPHHLSMRIYPNPFNPSTQIHFSLPADGLFSLRIFDINGRVVREWSHEQRNAGEHRMVWDGNDQTGKPVTSGMYFSELVYGIERQVAKMVLIR